MWVEATGDGRFARIRPMGHGLDATVTVVCSRVTVASVVVAARFSVGDGLLTGCYVDAPRTHPVNTLPDSQTSEW